MYPKTTVAFAGYRVQPLRACHLGFERIYRCHLEADVCIKLADRASLADAPAINHLDSQPLAHQSSAPDPSSPLSLAPTVSSPLPSISVAPFDIATSSDDEEQNMARRRFSARQNFLRQEDATNAFARVELASPVFNGSPRAAASQKAFSPTQFVDASNPFAAHATPGKKTPKTSNPAADHSIQKPSTPKRKATNSASEPSSSDTEDAIVLSSPLPRNLRSTRASTPRKRARKSSPPNTRSRATAVPSRTSPAKAAPPMTGFTDDEDERENGDVSSSSNNNRSQTENDEDEDDEIIPMTQRRRRAQSASSPATLKQPTRKTSTVVTDTEPSSSLEVPVSPRKRRLAHKNPGQVSPEKSKKQEEIDKEVAEDADSLKDLGMKAHTNSPGTHADLCRIFSLH